MKWAVEIQKTSLERRNLTDLLATLGFTVVDGIDFFAIASSLFEVLDTKEEVWAEAKRLREAMTGPSNIDSDFTLGAIIDYSTDIPKRHHFLEVHDSILAFSSFSATITVSPSIELSEEKLKEWYEAQAEQEYQATLQLQRSKLVPVFLEPRASKLLKLLQSDINNGETIYKIYELMEKHPKERKLFQTRFGISKEEFNRFKDAVHNPLVSGDLARHEYQQELNSINPMTIHEAKSFVEQLANRWLSTITTSSSTPKP